MCFLLISTLGYKFPQFILNTIRLFERIENQTLNWFHKSWGYSRAYYEYLCGCHVLSRNECSSQLKLIKISLEFRHKNFIVRFPLAHKSLVFPLFIVRQEIKETKTMDVHKSQMTANICHWPCHWELNFLMLQITSNDMYLQMCHTRNRILHLYHKFISSHVRATAEAIKQRKRGRLHDIVSQRQPEAL